MLLLIENGEVFNPKHIGRRSLLCSCGILQIGVDARKIAAADLELDVLDAGGCYVIPGFVDPHANTVGAGAEQGFHGRTPEMTFEEIIMAGVTTQVGTLGTDVVGRNLKNLLTKTIQLNQKGMTAFMYTGAFEVPPPSITESIKHDVALLQEVIGTGEVAISDSRSTAPTVQELARIVGDTKMGGMLGGKAGVTHFHIGEAKTRLAPLHQLLDRYPFEPHHIYPTHITRSRELLDEAIALAQRGCHVDMDVVDPGVGKWMRYYLEHGGPPERLTISSDAQTPGAGAASLHREFTKAVHEHGFELEELLPHFTCNVANVLKLPKKGRIEPDADADLVVLDKDTLQIRHVVARGRVFVRDGRFCDEPQPDPSRQTQDLATVET